MASPGHCHLRRDHGDVQYSYDNAQRLTGVLNQQGGSVISQHAYTLDSVGNRTALTETLAQIGGGTTTNTIAYSYDRLYRLTGDGTRSYGYDPVGNRLRLTQGGTTNYTYDRADRILSAGSVSYTVNANGNVTARGSDSFSYDQANRLTSATVSGTTTTYTYDGDGKRATQTVGGSTTSYVYDPNKALPDVLTDGTLKYVYGLGLAFGVDNAGNVQVYHSDGLGSVRAITNASGNLIQTYQTDPFGVPTQTQGSSTQPFQFTGEQRDGNGLIYLRARYDDPTTGRFVSRDTFPGVPFVPSSLNQYVYVQDRPTVFSDPTGQCLPFCAAPAIAGALEGGADVGITIAAGGALLSEYLIIIHHDDIGQNLDRLWSLIQDFGPPAQQIKIRVTNSATGEVIGELDTETGLVTGFQPQRKITSTTGTPPEFPVPPEPHYDRNAPWYNKLVFILAKLSDIISNLPH